MGVGAFTALSMGRPDPGAWQFVSTTGTISTFPAGLQDNDVVVITEGWGGQAGAPENPPDSTTFTLLAKRFTTSQIQPGVFLTSANRSSARAVTASLSSTSTGAYVNAVGSLSVFRRATPIADVPVVTAISRFSLQTSPQTQTIDYRGTQLPVMYGVSVIGTTTPIVVTFDSVEHTTPINNSLYWRTADIPYSKTVTITAAGVITAGFFMIR